MKRKKIKMAVFLVSTISLGMLLPFNTQLVKASTNEQNAVEASGKKDLAKTPPMGWNSWNTFMWNPNETVIKETADAMVENGLFEAGYEYVVLDDGYIEDRRDKDGKLVPHKTKFPNGFNVISDYIHDLGLKFGMYNSAGTGTCMGLPGSFGREEEDAKQFVEWGIDYFKYDFCNNPLVGTNIAYAPDLDKVTITKGDFSSEVEAESGELVGKATVSNGFVGWIGNNEGELILDIEVPEDGDYTLSFRYIGADGDRKAKIDVNDIEGETHTFPRTNGWGPSDAKNKEITLSLKAGVNELRIYNSGNDEAYNMEMAYKSYKAMTDEFLKYDSDVVFSICEWGSNKPWLWGDELGHLWRTTYDITAEAGKASWEKIVEIYDENVVLAEYAGPGGWNDPDMLVVGLDGINYEENKSHFSLWAIMASPLMLGNDVRNMSSEVLDILTNKEVIALNQDPLGKQAIRIRDDGDFEVLAKPLENGDVGVLLFNRSENSTSITTSIDEIVAGVELVNENMFAASDSYTVKDLWSNEEINITNELVGENIPAHGVQVYRIKANSENENKENLKVSIDLATKKLNESEEGLDNGNYHNGSKADLEEAINDAKLVYDNTGALDEEFIGAKINLDRALDLFEKRLITESTGDINEDGRVDLGDLSIASRYYGKFNPADKLNVKSDINSDGKVDSYELNFISNRTLN